MNYLNYEQSYIRKLNNVEKKKFFQKVKIIKQLYVKGPKSNSDLCYYLNISIPTSISLLNELVAEGLVEKQGRGLSIGGRKPDLFGLKDDSLYILSISMDQFTTRMVIFDNNNNKKSETRSFSVPLSKDLKAADAICRKGNDLMIDSGIDMEKFMGVSISLPGLISSREGKSFTYLQSGSETLQTYLEKQFKKPVHVQNDAKSAALAELNFGLAKGKKDVLTLSMDWYIGTGIIMDGKLLSGSSGFSGEFGHIPITDEGTLCHCGKRGCLETVASNMVLVEKAHNALKTGEHTLLKNLSPNEIENLGPQHIIEAANLGDQYSINLLSELGLNLGKGISVLIQLFNPELIIIGGKIANAEQYILTPVQQAINTYCMKQLSEKTNVVLSELGENAGILGSVATFMDFIYEDKADFTS